jgi:hypothetical protein
MSDLIALLILAGAFVGLFGLIAVCDGVRR